MIDVSMSAFKLFVGDILMGGGVLLMFSSRNTQKQSQLFFQGDANSCCHCILTHFKHVR